MSLDIFVPSHVTGFFQIMNHSNLYDKGSLGAGFLIDKGVSTQIKETRGDEVKFIINGEENHYYGKINYKTLELIRENYSIETGFKVSQELGVPVGCGFGTSACSAMGVAIGITKLLDNDLSIKQACDYAHKAEVLLGTGLGDVIASTSHGFVMRTREGSPTHGEVKNFACDSDLYVISKSLGNIETSSVINSPKYRKRINSIGGIMLKELLKKPDIENFLELSYTFANKTSLLNNKVDELIKILNQETLGSSMAMLGNTVFALSDTPDTSIENTQVSKIDNKGITIK